MLVPVAYMLHVNVHMEYSLVIFWMENGLINVHRGMRAMKATQLFCFLTDGY